MTGEDIAAAILWVAELPPHLNINRLELMPVSQSFAGHAGGPRQLGRNPGSNEDSDGPIRQRRLAHGRRFPARHEPAISCGPTRRSATG